jgi:hypothetical protein
MTKSVMETIKSVYCNFGISQVENNFLLMFENFLELITLLKLKQ